MNRLIAPASLRAWHTHRLQRHLTPHASVLLQPFARLASFAAAPLSKPAFPHFPGLTPFFLGAPVSHRSRPFSTALRLLDAQPPKHTFKTLDSAPDDSSSSKKSHKTANLIREYGPLAVLVYAFFSSITFICCLSSIYFLGVDRERIMGWLTSAKALIGWKDDSQHKEVKTEVEGREESKRSLFDFLPESLKSEAVLTLGTNILLAMVMTKLFVPVKLTLVAFVTPVVARRLRHMGFDLGQRGAYSNVAKDVRAAMKEKRGRP